MGMFAVREPYTALSRCRRSEHRRDTRSQYHRSLYRPIRNARPLAQSRSARWRIRSESVRALRACVARHYHDRLCYVQVWRSEAFPLISNPGGLS